MNTIDLAQTSGPSPGNNSKRTNQRGTSVVDGVAFHAPASERDTQTTETEAQPKSVADMLKREPDLLLEHPELAPQILQHFGDMWNIALLTYAGIADSQGIETAKEVRKIMHTLQIEGEEYRCIARAFKDYIVLMGLENVQRLNRGEAAGAVA